MQPQLYEPTPIHQAASQIAEAIARLYDALVSSKCDPEVEKLEQSLKSIRNESERLQRALDANDTERVLKEMEHLCEKVAEATRKFKFLSTV